MKLSTIITTATILLTTVACGNKPATLETTVETTNQVSAIQYDTTAELIEGAKGSRDLCFNFAKLVLSPNNVALTHESAKDLCDKQADLLSKDVDAFLSANPQSTTDPQSLIDLAEVKTYQDEIAYIANEFDL